jgi:hypothetical protein
MTPGFDKHELECPHCQKRTPLLWPGSTILFATAKCEHCSKEFVVVENKPENSPGIQHSAFGPMPGGLTGGSLSVTPDPALSLCPTAGNHCLAEC